MPLAHAPLHPPRTAPHIAVCPSHPLTPPTIPLTNTPLTPPYGPPYNPPYNPPSPYLAPSVQERIAACNTLGLQPQPTHHELRKAYRALALVHHPDKLQPDASAAQREAAATKVQPQP